MALNLRRPLDKVIVDIKSGRLTLEWDTFFNNLSTIVSSTTGNVIGIQTFTSSGTYTPGLTASSARIICVGGGGGGGGTGGIAVGQNGGGGGGSGGYSEHYATTLVSTTVTVGLGGTAGGAYNDANGNGLSGGVTSFGALCQANGGLGGAGASTYSNTFTAGGPGGALGVGNVMSSSGNDGGTSGRITTAQYGVFGGAGAPSFFGGGRAGPIISGGVAETNTTTAGNQGLGYGSGGSGAASHNTATGAIGGAGASGICIVYEYS